MKKYRFFNEEAFLSIVNEKEPLIYVKKESFCDFFGINIDLYAKNDFYTLNIDDTKKDEIPTESGYINHKDVVNLKR